MTDSSSQLYRLQIAADLLLGTQGWRRFAFVFPDEYVEYAETDIRPVSLRPQFSLADILTRILIPQETIPVLNKAKTKLAAERLLAYKEVRSSF